MTPTAIAKPGQPLAEVERDALVALSAELRAIALDDTPMDSMLERCGGAIAARLGVALTRVWWLEPGECGLRLVASAGSAATTPMGAPGSPMDADLAGRIAARGRSFFSGDLRKLRAGVPPWVDATGLFALAGYPIVSAGRVSAVLEVFDEHPLSGSSRRALDVLTDIMASDILRRRVEETRRQRETRQSESTKMEAIGHLANQIAHDFNNHLTSILGYGALALSNIEAGHPARCDLEEMVAAAKRASSLTQRLLMLGRKPTGHPHVIDVNTVVTGIEGELRRILGDRVALRAQLATGPMWVRADALRIEQALMSLASNAHDACVEGGTLTVSIMRLEAKPVAERAGFAAATVSPSADDSERTGGRIALTVADDGAGMSAEVRARLFEPFFTTKPRGEGSGLGLATVYATVLQCGGTMSVDTAPGRGAAFHIELPEVKAPEAASQQAVEEMPASGSLVRAGAPREPRGSPASGVCTETVLIVDDEPMVRRIASHVLRAKGYHLLQASSASEAIEMANTHPGPIHLVITDVAMPGTSGRALGERFATIRPECRLLLMSGHLRGQEAGTAALDVRTAFVQKPFTSTQLATKVRDVLDRPLQPAA